MSCYRTLVYDLDSELPFPTYFHKYVTETFRTDAILNPEYHRQFRVVPAASFLNTFASDRRHMRKADMPAMLDNVNGRLQYSDRATTTIDNWRQLV